MDEWAEAGEEAITASQSPESVMDLSPVVMHPKQAVDMVTEDGIEANTPVSKKKKNKKGKKKKAEATGVLLDEVH